MSYTVVEKEALSSDGIHTLYGKVYVPEGEIKGIFQIAHGMAEHIERYRGFMAFMAEAGYVAFAHDHVGHGKTGSAVGKLGFIAENGGHRILVEDVRVFAQAVKADFPDKPHILMGHSMGSFIARNYASKYGKELSGLVLMGTGGPNPAASIGITLAKAVKKRYGAQHVSPLISNLAFGGYNSRTEKQSGFDWLSVNRANIDKYLKDDLCGFPFTVSAMQDLITLTYLCNTDAWARSVPKNLPVYLVAGDEDPVGAYGEGVKRVGFMLSRAGVKYAKVKLYRGYRHEILNEDCASTVCEDILAFAEKSVYDAKFSSIKAKCEKIKRIIAKTIIERAKTTRQILSIPLGENVAGISSKYPVSYGYTENGSVKDGVKIDSLVIEFLNLDWEMQSILTRQKTRMGIFENVIGGFKKNFDFIKSVIRKERGKLTDEQEIAFFDDELGWFIQYEDYFGKFDEE